MKYPRQYPPWLFSAGYWLRLLARGRARSWSRLGAAGHISRRGRFGNSAANSPSCRRLGDTRRAAGQGERPRHRQSLVLAGQGFDLRLKIVLQSDLSQYRDLRFQPVDVLLGIGEDGGKDAARYEILHRFAVRDGLLERLLRT